MKYPLIKAMCKLGWLIGVIFYLLCFFKEAQAHNWPGVLFWAFMVCVCAEASSKLRWKNASITTTINDETYIEWYWTNRGASKEFDKSAAEILEACRARGIPVHDHTVATRRHTEKK